MENRSRNLLTVFLVVGAVVFGMVLAAGLEWTPDIYAAPDRAAGPQAVDTRNRVSPSSGFADLVESVAPAVVSIQATSFQPRGRVQAPQDIFEFFFGPPGERQEPEGGERRQIAGGSGFLISSDGLIATNNHVVEGAERLEVRLDDGRTYEAEIRGTDPTTDLALLQLTTEVAGLPYLEIGDSDELRVGDWVMVIGSPLALGRTVTVGVVSGKGRSTGQLLGEFGIENFIQTDAAINLGNSGGPMLNMRGEVVGIATAIQSPAIAENVGFAVPSETLSGVLPQLRETGEVRRGYLGVGIDELDQQAKEAFGIERDGVLVVTVQPGTPAVEAGLKPGDVILSIDGERTETPQEVINYVANRAPGTVVGIDFVRDGERRSAELTLGERPTPGEPTRPEGEEEPSGIEWLGMSYQSLTPRLRAAHGIPDDIEGVWVSDITARSPLAGEGVRAGDVITEVNGEPVTRVSEFEEAVESVEAGEYLRLYVHRFGRGGQSVQFFAFVQAPSS